MNDRKYTVFHDLILFLQINSYTIASWLAIYIKNFNIANTRRQSRVNLVDFTSISIVPATV